jgi:hypothetical protein
MLFIVGLRCPKWKTKHAILKPTAKPIENTLAITIIAMFQNWSLCGIVSVLGLAS